MAQKLRKHRKKLEKTSVGCHIDFTILLSMLKVKGVYITRTRFPDALKQSYIEKYTAFFVQNNYFLYKN